MMNRILENFKYFFSKYSCRYICHFREVLAVRLLKDICLKLT